MSTVGRSSLWSGFTRLLKAVSLGAVFAGAALAGATPGCGGDSAPPDASKEWQNCQGSDQAFVRRAMWALNGRRPFGQAEVNVYEDAIKSIREVGGYDDAGLTYGPTIVEPRRIVARTMMNENAFRERWSEFFMDALLVSREDKPRVSEYDQVQMKACYGAPLSKPIDKGALAAWVRDNAAAAADPPIFDFNLGHLLSSTIELDDLSPLYRAHLFALVSFPLSGANVEPLELERSRRLDFAATFGAAYIHRDLTCLPCHNSEFSVTASPDPAKNRAWPVPGHFEAALYGASSGAHPSDEAAGKGEDRLRAISFLRYDGVGAPIQTADDVNKPPGQAPFGWDGNACGRLKVPQTPDFLNVDTFFGSIRSTPQEPQRGLFASVWAVDPALRRGFAQLAEKGLTFQDSDQTVEPDEAFAYLVALNIVEKVWTEVIGTRLTIANYFPRTEVQRDILKELTDQFIASRYSLKTLLLDIVTHPAFNLTPPDAGCGASPYNLPRIYLPWTDVEAEPAKRGNSPGDGVVPLPTGPLRRAMHQAMEWPSVPDFPRDDELAFQIVTGHFIKSAEPGFRGLDFQGRLAWEKIYGACSNPVAKDFISSLLEEAKTQGATVGDVVIAFKDRLLGEPWIDADGEEAELSELLGAPLKSTDLSNLDARMRLVCGAYLGSPQFLLDGIMPKDHRTVPRLTPKDVSYDAVCARAAGQVSSLDVPYTLSCEEGVIAGLR
jgi:hypothetical protein